MLASRGQLVRARLEQVRECRAGAGEDKGTQAADWPSSVNKRSAVIEVVVFRVSEAAGVMHQIGRAVSESAPLQQRSMRQDWSVIRASELSREQSANSGDARP